MRTDALSQKETSQLIVLLTAYPIKYCFRLAPLHRGSFGILPKKAGLQTFLHSQAPSQEFSMAFMLRSHNGVHCCGTVGDSHPSSQLSTAKCTFTGDSFQNHAARTVQTECNRARSNCRGAASLAKYQILFENFRNREALATIGTQEQKYFDEVKVTKKVLLRPTVRSFKDVLTCFGLIVLSPCVPNFSP